MKFYQHAFESKRSGIITWTHDNVNQESIAHTLLRLGKLATKMDESRNSLSCHKEAIMLSYEKAGGDHNENICIFQAIFILSSVLKNYR